MSQLPRSASRLLEQARAHDREQAVNLEPTLVSLHAALPFADPGPALSLGEELGGDVSAGSTAPTSIAPAASAGAKGIGTALFTGKALKIFLATLALSGAAASVRWQRATPEAARESSPAASPVAAAAAPSIADGAASAQQHLAPVQDPASSAGANAPVAMAEPVRAPRNARANTGRAADARTAPTSAAPGVKSEQVSATRASEAPEIRAPQPAAVPRELDLIDAALSRLHAHQTDAALALLRQHAELYPSGKFGTERQGLRVLALCAAGQLDQGRSEQARFLATQASTPIATQVRAACKEPR